MFAIVEGVSIELQSLSSADDVAEGYIHTDHHGSVKVIARMPSMKSACRYVTNNISAVNDMSTVSIIPID
jgi:hypothetical protein